MADHKKTVGVINMVSAFVELLCFAHHQDVEGVVDGVTMPALKCFDVRPFQLQFSAKVDPSVTGLAGNAT